MWDRNFDVNEEGCSIRCRLYCSEPKAIRRIVIFGHGFGGHKDNKAAARFAQKAVAKHKDVGVVTFNWPCHGDDGRKNLLLEDCDNYLRILLDYLKKQYNTDRIYAYATSFGGYMFLRYIHIYGNPFVKTALRCPAINMYDSMISRIMNDGDMEKIEKGKPVLAGFDRKIKITGDFLENLKKDDIRTWDFIDESESIFILHGTKDEVIPFEESRKFADDNIIEFLPVENADHRFIDPVLMDLAIQKIIGFFEF